MAAIHAKKLDFSCENCKHDSELKTYLGCDNPTQMAVWENDEYEFFSCPLNFIADSVVDWWEEYLYYKSFSGSSPLYKNQSAKFVEAMYLYNKLLNSYLVEPEDRKTEEGLQILRRSFNARRNH